MSRLTGLTCIFLLVCGPAAAEVLTALRVIRPHTVIGPADLGTLNRVVQGALTPSDAVVGLETRVTLYPGQPILPNQLGAPALVERNQPVLVIFRRNSLTISADGRALSRGAAGDTVRVMNLASRNTVNGTVQPDGSVVVGMRGQ